MTVVPERFAEHLASVLLENTTQCELVAETGHQRCPNKAGWVKWEDGFADAVCYQHAANAKERGAVVVLADRHNGEQGDTDE